MCVVCVGGGGMQLLFVTTTLTHNIHTERSHRDFPRWPPSSSSPTRQISPFLSCRFRSWFVLVVFVVCWFGVLSRGRFLVACGQYFRRYLCFCSELLGCVLPARLRSSRRGYLGCYTREAPVAQSATWVGSSLLDSSMLLLFRQPITSPIIVFTSGPTCLLVQIILSASATSPAPPAILPFLLVGCCDCRWLRNDFSIPHAPEKMCHKKTSLKFISTFGRNTTLSLEYLGPVAVFQ